MVELYRKMRKVGGRAWEPISRYSETEPPDRRRFAFQISRVLDFAGDRLHHLCRRRFAAEVRRADFPAGHHALDSGDDAVVEILVAEMLKHQTAGPGGADRICDALAGDVRSGSVDGLEHRRVV